MKRSQTTTSTGSGAETGDHRSSWTPWLVLIPVLATLTALTALATTTGNATAFWIFAPGMIALFGSYIFLAFDEKPLNRRAAMAIVIAASATVTLWAIGQLTTVTG